jgi:hypothetical protein
MFKTALAVLLVSAGIAAAVLFGTGDSSPPESGKGRASLSTVLTGNFRDGVRFAEDSVAELARVSASKTSEGAPKGDPSVDGEWAKLERVRSNPSLFVRMRANRAVSFRDPLLNPDDVYVDTASRAALNAAFSTAIEKVENLRKMRRAIAHEQILTLASEGRFVPWKGKAMQLAGRVSENPVGDGWYTFMAADGVQYKVQWEDLTWTKVSEELAVALEMQIDAMVADFFVNRCGLSTEARDIVFIYGLGDGPNRLRELATENPQEYRRIRLILTGH